MVVTWNFGFFLATWNPQKKRWWLLIGAMNLSARSVVSMSIDDLSPPPPLLQAPPPASNRRWQAYVSAREQTTGSHRTAYGPPSRLRTGRVRTGSHVQVLGRRPDGSRWWREHPARRSAPVRTMPRSCHSG